MGYRLVSQLRVRKEKRAVDTVVRDGRDQKEWLLLIFEYPPVSWFGWGRKIPLIFSSIKLWSKCNSSSGKENESYAPWFGLGNGNAFIFTVLSLLMKPSCSVVVKSTTDQWWYHRILTHVSGSERLSCNSWKELLFQRRSKGAIYMNALSDKRGALYPLL